MQRIRPRYNSEYVWNFSSLKTIGGDLLMDDGPLAVNEVALAPGDYVYARNIGAYSRASSTWFNGFPPAKTVHLNQ